MKLLGCYISLILVSVVLFGCGDSSAPVRDTTSDTLRVNLPRERVQVRSLTQERIAEFAKKNPCYLPMLRDSTLYESGNRVGFSFDELLNGRLAEGNRFRNRYLVGDFNVLDELGNVRGVEEVYPVLNELLDFSDLDSGVVNLLERSGIDNSLLPELESRLRSGFPEVAEVILNFYSKVWKYRTPPLKRKYGISGGDVYAAGQRLCMCEAREDTLLFHGQFAVSGKRQSPGGGKMHESLPIGNRRNYYGARYAISSKNWERERKYELLDIAHDEELGGGNNQVTFYKGRAELPNFLLLEPHDEYPRAMTSNGIHEVALSELSRGMLGAPNSIGCIRVTDFGSKFLRWWTPQDCPLFILYANDRYVKKMDNMNAAEVRPFKSQSEGDRFRYWMNTYLPEQAKFMEVDPEGDYLSEYLIDAYIAHRQAYDDWLRGRSD